MSQAETPESLRAKARRIRQSAQYALSCYYSEMQEAKEIEAKADKLEATQKLQEERRKNCLQKSKLRKNSC